MASNVLPMGTARAKARPSVTPSFGRGAAVAFLIALLFWAVVALALILAF